MPRDPRRELLYLAVIGEGGTVRHGNISGHGSAWGRWVVCEAARIAVKPGQRPQLVYRVHHGRGSRKGQRKGFTEAGYAWLLDACTSNWAARSWSPGTIRMPTGTTWPRREDTPNP